MNYHILEGELIMLGIASERVFLLVCNSMLESLEGQKEQKKFKKVLEGTNMVQKMISIEEKLKKFKNILKNKGIKGFPENAEMKLKVIYDFQAMSSLVNSQFFKFFMICKIFK